MLGNNFLKISNSNALSVSHNILGTVSVRWRRKPRWLPTAPSKVFRVPERHVLPLDEKLEWQRLNNIYRTQVSSIRRYLIHEVEDRKKMVELQATPADEEAEFQRCFSINEQWNQDIAKDRMARVEAENEKRREEILLKIEKRKIREQEKMMEIEERIKREEVQSKSYITRENIDQIIEAALANPVNFNYSIDLQGKRSDEIVPKE